MGIDVGTYGKSLEKSWEITYADGGSFPAKAKLNCWFHPMTVDICGDVG